MHHHSIFKFRYFGFKFMLIMYVVWRRASATQRARTSWFRDACCEIGPSMEILLPFNFFQNPNGKVKSTGLECRRPMIRTTKTKKNGNVGQVKILIQSLYVIICDHILWASLSLYIKITCYCYQKLLVTLGGSYYDCIYHVIDVSLYCWRRLL